MRTLAVIIIYASEMNLIGIAGILVDGMWSYCFSASFHF